MLACVSANSLDQMIFFLSLALTFKKNSFAAAFGIEKSISISQYSSLYCVYRESRQVVGLLLHRDVVKGG